MGVEHKTELEGDYPVELFCTACETEYCPPIHESAVRSGISIEMPHWTDEQSDKQCPSCGSYYDWEVTERQ